MTEMFDNEDLPDIQDLALEDYLSDYDKMEVPQNALDDDAMEDIDDFSGTNKTSNDYAWLPQDQAYAPWMTPAMCRAPTTIIPFDGKGKNPSTLVGLKVQRYRFEKGTACLDIKWTTEQVLFFSGETRSSLEPQKPQKPKSIFGPEEDEEDEYEDDDNSDYDGISIDSNLSQALDFIGRYPHCGPLTIEEAVVGIRESKVTDFGTNRYSVKKHRVVGLRLEGMAEMGFIAYKTERDRDDDPGHTDGTDSDSDGEKSYMVGYEDVVVAEKAVEGLEGEGGGY